VTSIGYARSALTLAAVLVPYWVVVLTAVRWGIWGGGDPIEVGQAIQRHLGDLFLPPFGAHGLVVIPLVVGGTAAAVWTLIRARSEHTPSGDPCVWLAALLGVPYVLMMLVYAAILLMFLITCWNSGCTMVL
jgi:hypothetical protein